MSPATTASTADILKRATLWPETIGRHRLPGSRIEADGVDDRYARFVAHAVPGLQLLSHLLAERAYIAALFGVTPTQIQLGKHPSGPPRFRLTVAAVDPLAAPAPATEPYGDHGTIILGPYFDSDGEANWQLHSAGNTHSGVIIAGPHSGATSLTELIAVSARATIPTSLVYLDGYDGLSSPLLSAHANLAGDTTLATTVPDILDRLEQVIHDRRRTLVTESRIRLTVSDTDPLVLVVIDGGSRIFGGPDQFAIAARWARVAILGRKTGVALAVTLASGSVADFGADARLRDVLCHVNLIGLRTPGVRTGCRSELAVLNELPPAPGVGLHIRHCDAQPREFRARHLAAGQAKQLLTDHPGHALPGT